MGKILLKILKVLAVILLIAIAGGLLYWLCRKQGWPLWVGGAILAGLIGAVVAFLFIKKHLLRSREKKFVQRVIEQDQSAIKMSPAKDRQQLLDLQDSWKEAIGRLQQSKLRKLGNPLYVLPWYLILGESGSGKTSAVKNARIDSSMTEVSRSAGISGTRNCDWWFFDEGVILDTAGRYAVPVDEGQDLEEWKQFLVLLSQYRKKEPLNGVVVTIAADKLLTSDDAALREEGHCIRQRIDQMMRTMGVQFPVYLLITKMDLVHGFVDFSSLLPGASLAQAMGFTHSAPHPHWQEVLSLAMTRIAGSLKDLRLVVLHKTPRPAPGVVIFPNEFERLQGGLSGFLNALFEENTYQETPLLRGLYFTSAVRSGRPVSDFLQTTGVEPPAGAPDSGAGVFIKDFFSSILPADRNLFSPLKEYVLWRRLTQQLGLVAWLLIGACACGLLTFSFYKNYTVLDNFRTFFFDPPKLSDNRGADLIMLDKMRLEILNMEEANRRWWLPRLGLSHSREVETRLKNQFTRLFNGGFLIPLDYWLGNRINEVSQKTPEDVFADYIGYVVARISVLEEHLAGKRLTDEDTFQRITTALIQGRDKNTAQEVAGEFANIYYAYLAWGRDRADSQESVETLRRALIQLLSKKGADLRWLVEKWVPGEPGLHLNDFWGAAAIGQSQGKVVIPGGFTEKGRKNIGSFIEKISVALGDGAMKATFQNNTKEFWIWYRQEFYYIWESFIKDFHQASVRIDSIAGWQRLVGLMSTRQNPYFLLLNRAADEIAAMKPDKDAPQWARLIVALKSIRDLAEAQRAKQQQGGSLAGSLKVKTEELKGQALATIDPAEAREQENRLAQAGAMEAFLEAMGKLEGTVASQKQAFDSYAACFSYLDAKGGAGAPSAFTTAYDSYYKLKNTLFTLKDVPVVWDLIFGPLDFIMAYAADESACFLQDQWEEQVLGAIEGADPAKVSKLLFDKTSGVVWAFANGTAKPFLGRNKNGYFARSDFRKNQLPLSGAFIHFLNAGADAAIDAQPSYSVTLATVPISVNAGAGIKPYGNLLAVDCSEKGLSLDNYNFPNSAAFSWAPDTCGDTTLRIVFQDLTLEKRYPGPLGFAGFLKAFRDGTLKFTPNDFPEHASAIKRMGISWIRVAYNITGAAPVIQLLSQTPTEVPAEIVPCWSRSHQ
ncbi:MAG: type VI secretion protein IcmF/TssM N-terminal domain-containing protein [Pseudomonadota bacterium]